MVIDGKHDRYCVSVKMHLQSGRIIYQCKRQHDRFAILDGVEVPYGQFGEAFCSDTAETAISILDQYRFTVRKNQWLTAYRLPYGKRLNDILFVANSPAEMNRGRSEYMLARFSSNSMPARWLLIINIPFPNALIYIMSPERCMSASFYGTVKA